MHTRIQSLFIGFLFVLAVIVLRLSYWQIIKADDLKEQANAQYSSRDVVEGSRGSIITQDGAPLVVNQVVYTLGAYLPAVDITPNSIVDQIMPLISYTIDDPGIATDEAKLKLATEELKSTSKKIMLERLGKSSYAVLARSLSVTEKLDIEALGIKGLTFEQSFTRQYPEASMSAQLTGFVGRDDLGKPTGYFGLEGYYDRELSGLTEIAKQEKDSSGNPLLIGDYQFLPGRSGRTLRLHLERGTQYMVEEELKSGLERYGASSGEIIVMDPSTGAILAMASLPSYDQAKFHLYETQLYKNPAVANSYEPGSTFKVFVMAAALSEGVVDEADECDICSSPYPIGKYTIKTWDNKYVGGRTPEQIIANSDNVGMVWTQQRLGGDKLKEYIERFGFGQKTGIDLQEEITPRLRDRWGDIDYATASFGQGIAVTSVQMMQAVSALANQGVMMEPHLVKSVIGESEVEIPPKEKGRVITEDAAKRITEIMVKSVKEGEAKWASPQGYRIAGKTGTAQIAVGGNYARDKTTASFIGFAPADNPKFAMIVKLSEPQSSPWASETAAPLWFSIAKKLLLRYNIAPTD